MDKFDGDRRTQNARYFEKMLVKNKTIPVTCQAFFGDKKDEKERDGPPWLFRKKKGVGPASIFIDNPTPLSYFYFDWAYA